MGALQERPFHEPLKTLLAGPASQGLKLFWLGQAGFVIDVDGRRLVVDPYLSNSLAEKYAGTARPHRRMMPPPVEPDEIRHVDLVLATHAHTDHMDPGTLPLLLAANPAARFVAPRAERQQALARSGIAEARLVLTDAGESLALLPGLSIYPTRAAHETLDVDGEGNHRFLGYFIETHHVRLWHSGDCIPFDGLVEEVTRLRPDIALLPVNGRRPELSENGVAGNFSLQEAIEIADRVGAQGLVAHHYGLFDFNTEDPLRIDAAGLGLSDLRLLRAKTQVALVSAKQ